jgi:ribosomal protein L12E/L44/L45/RPP1/RPP2
MSARITAEQPALPEKQIDEVTQRTQRAMATTPRMLRATERRARQKEKTNEQT